MDISYNKVLEPLIVTVDTLRDNGTIVVTKETSPVENEYPNGTQDDNYYCEIWISVKQE